jgi:hypothetical protein
MATMTMEAILDRVQEMKQEAEEKDEVIRVQQEQIDELESKVKDAEARCAELESKATQMNEAAQSAEALVDKLSQILG